MMGPKPTDCDPRMGPNWGRISKKRKKITLGKRAQQAVANMVDPRGGAWSVWGNTDGQHLADGAYAVRPEGDNEKRPAQI